LISVVIEKVGKARVKFKAFDASDLNAVPEKTLRSNLIKSGLWTSFRTRPFNKVPTVDSTPNAIFINAMDTNPLAANPEVIIAQDTGAFKNGLKVLSGFGVDLFLAKAPNATIPEEGGVIKMWSQSAVCLQLVT